MNENMNHTMGMLRKCQEEKEMPDIEVEEIDGGMKVSFQESIAFSVDNSITEFIEEKVKEGFPFLREYAFNINNIASALKKTIPMEVEWKEVELGLPNREKMRVAICPECKADAVNHGLGWVCSNSCCRQALKRQGV